MAESEVKLMGAKVLLLIAIAVANVIVDNMND